MSMEIVIPPRAHGQSTDRYVYDGHGDPIQVVRVSEKVAEKDQSTERTRKGRQKVHWPFQSVATEADLVDVTRPSTAQTEIARRATWQQPRRLRIGNSGDSIVEDLIPDYVVNYIRGETPETVARRKKNGGKLAERGVDVAHHKRHGSHAAMLVVLEGDEVDRSTTGSPGAYDEEQGLTGSHERKRRHRPWRLTDAGWRVGVTWNALLSLLLLVLVAAGLAMAVVAGSFSVWQSSIVYSGPCATIAIMDCILHAAVSMLVVVSLGGANYTFQVLSAPTREEVDRAHEKKEWLDIGVPSIRNLGHIAASRAVLALVMLAAAISIHIIYNAVIFTTQPAVNYNTLFVTSTFLTGAPFTTDSSSNAAGLSRADMLAVQSMAGQNQLANLTTFDCLQRFSAPFETEYNALLVVTDSQRQTNSLLQTAGPSALLTQYVGRNSEGDVILTLDESTVRYCLAQSAPEATCAVVLNGGLLGLVACLSLITTAVFGMALFFLKPSFAPLVTLGDAITSFLGKSDPTTQGSCLMTKKHVWQGGAKSWSPEKHHRWLQTPSLSRWLLAILIWISVVGLAGAALVHCVLADPTHQLSLTLGSTRADLVLELPLPVIAVVLVANIPQLFLAALYLVFNGLLTTYFLSHESSLFSVGTPRPLRVSCSAPEGFQNSSLYLTLPRPVSWFLTILFACASFALTQGVFVVVADRSLSSFSPASPFPTSSSTVVGVGFRNLGLVCLLGLLLVLAATVVGLGMRRAPAALRADNDAVTVGNPLVMPGGSCSAVISARCHALPGEESLWAKQLVWGVVQEGSATHHSHCSYTAERAAPLQPGKSYV